MSKQNVKMAAVVCTEIGVVCSAGIGANYLCRDKAKVGIEYHCSLFMFAGVSTIGYSPQQSFTCLLIL